jgi:microcystin-dependent protein
MAEPFLGEIRLMSFGFAPKGWALCNGQILPINQNQALFALLGTNYGGNGTVNFALPNLQGRVPVHGSNGAVYPLGAGGGEENHTLQSNELPAHIHVANASSAAAATPAPAGGVLASATNVYGPAASLIAVRNGTIAPAGGGQAHQNMQPFLVLNFCIALQGIFPSRN